METMFSVRSDVLLFEGIDLSEHQERRRRKILPQILGRVQIDSPRTHATNGTGFFVKCRIGRDFPAFAAGIPRDFAAFVVGALPNAGDVAKVGRC